MKNIVYKDKILTDRERKNLAILETIRKEGPITKTEISKKCGTEHCDDYELHDTLSFATLLA